MIIQVILGGRVGTIISKSLSDFLACETVPKEYMSVSVLTSKAPELVEARFSDR